MTITKTLATKIARDALRAGHYTFTDKYGSGIRQYCPLCKADIQVHSKKTADLRAWIVDHLVDRECNTNTFNYNTADRYGIPHDHPEEEH
jgi:hypothetical protein